MLTLLDILSINFISNNAQTFLDHKCINLNVPKLKEFMGRKEQPSHFQIERKIGEYASLAT